MAAHDRMFSFESRRMELLTILIGLAAAVGSGHRWGARAGIGVGLGAVLSWLNLRWMTLGVRAIGKSSGPNADQNAKLPKGVSFRFVGRYALLLAVAYVSVVGFKLPAIALVGGLFASAAAVMAEAVWHLLQTAGDR